MNMALQRAVPISTAWFAVLTLWFALNKPVSVSAQTTLASAPTPSSSASPQRMQWWTEARFGMFIHWGLYAQDGCFWQGQDGKSEHMMRNLKIPIVEYEKITKEFNPTNFDAREWVRIAKAAGMKYLVITAKHHDGFAMFNSPSDTYNIVARTPFKRDPVEELAAECRTEGIRFGVYYSLGRDWHDPDVPTRNAYRSNTWDFPDENKKDFSRYFERKVKPQVRELLTQYGPIDILWFDTPEKISKTQSTELIALIHQLQPRCIINARVGNHLGDYAVQEQKIPDIPEAKPWETCMTLNDHWGYHKLDENWKTPETLVRRLVEVASKGGNFLLNVGPTGQGVFPQPAVEQLRKVGQWMKLNGAAIYGTTGSPFRSPLPWGFCTEKSSLAGTLLYLHVFNPPKDGKLLLPIKNTTFHAFLLASGRDVEGTSTAMGLQLRAPALNPKEISTTLVVQVEGPLLLQ